MLNSNGKAGGVISTLDVKFYRTEGAFQCPKGSTLGKNHTRNSRAYALQPVIVLNSLVVLRTLAGGFLTARLLGSHRHLLRIQLLNQGCSFRFTGLCQLCRLFLT